eukprot:CAMPEP_0116567104 /NCGR_PEP_ID=MMETSP0397-20121206/14815_1 /TAXON_ID=216820 /ORGANISM="Cyclophora tenuis, Strain ECT3854" /LENGTH=266 /DNA_ID=CAMNT_0004094045 /DNA_START=89 /DNA_END=889 /DNA_ORIENTATION=+
MAFHATPRRQEEVKKEEDKPSTGLVPWIALPIGVAAAVPLLQYEWLVVNEETQLAACFMAFCVVMYTQGGDAMYKALDETAQKILKEHNEAEEKVIEALEEQLESLKANGNIVNDFEAINKMREETYIKLNAAGKIKPQHDFKAQIERMITMIKAEEQNVAEKAKIALMEEATASVTAQFEESKGLKKAALDAAIASIKGGGGGSDPVHGAFIDFFKNKAVEAAAIDDSSEAAAQRASMVAKLNSVCKNEEFFFQFDEAGKPKMIV